MGREWSWDSMLIKVTIWTLSIIVHLPSGGNTSWRSGQDLGKLYDNVTPNPTGSLSGPYFLESIKTRVVGVSGKTSNLACTVKNLGNQTVSWVRHEDTHLLTTGMYRYTPDTRFSSLHKPSSEHWVLELRDTQMSDQGDYECQISTTPVRSLKFLLQVVESYTTLLGSLVRHVDVGSGLNITCAVVNYPLKLEYIIFYHNNKQINGERSGPYRISKIQSDGGTNYSSWLTVSSASVHQSGSYHCAANPGQSQSVTVHVHHGENPAGLQTNGGSRLQLGLGLAIILWAPILISIPRRSICSLQGTVLH